MSEVNIKVENSCDDFMLLLLDKVNKLEEKVEDMQSKCCKFKVKS